MEITDIKIRRIITEGRLRAVVSVTIDDMLAVHDIKVVQGDERLFVAMPSRKDENGVFRDIVHPISSEARKMMEEQILETYHRHLALMEAEAQEEAMQNFSKIQKIFSADRLLGGLFLRSYEFFRCCNRKYVLSRAICVLASGI